MIARLGEAETIHGAASAGRRDGPGRRREVSIDESAMRAA